MPKVDSLIKQNGASNGVAGVNYYDKAIPKELIDKVPHPSA
jgi:hypothetical protein